MLDMFLYTTIACNPIYDNLWYFQNFFFFVGILVVYSKNFLLSNGNKNFSNSSIIDLLYSYAKIYENYLDTEKMEYIWDVMLLVYVYTVVLVRAIYVCIIYLYRKYNNETTGPDNYCSIFAIHIIWHVIMLSSIHIKSVSQRCFVWEENWRFGV